MDTLLGIPRVVLRFQAVAALALLLGGDGTAHAQSGAARREVPELAASFGTVSGHITLAGSNVPARLASVALQPVEIKPEEHTPGKPPAGNFTVYQTDLDGGYMLPRVAPGRYYLVVRLPGYLSPFDQFTSAELEHPDSSVQQRIDATLPVISVRPNATTTFDLQIRRGAGMGGTVRFEDGTPFPEATVSIVRRDPDGKWVAPHASSATRTRDDGQWYLSGLSPGEYRVRVNLTLAESKQSSLLGENGFRSMHFLYTLSIYSDVATRARDAKSITLAEAQEMSGVDITVPVSRLHSVSGSVVDARTGQALNDGKVELVYADDATPLATVPIDYESRSFTFNFVPEGEYRLLVKSAREIRREATASDTSFGASIGENDAVLRNYASGEEPLTVTGSDKTNLTLPVSERSAARQPKGAKSSSQ